jgi:choline dehydrogenase-like flavoprotein
MIYGPSTFLYAEGRCVGGSTVINGGMCYRPPEAVLARWGAEVAPELGARGLERYLARAEADVSARPQGAWSVGGDNLLLAEGAARLGWRHQRNDRNQVACVGTNNCVLGCPTGAKRSTLVSYMPRAIRAGAQALTELRAEALVIEGGRCVGVRARAIDPRTMRPAARVTLRARAVVVAGGAIQTPLLLLRHRLGRPSGQLGRNFTTHPNAKILALYPFEVQAWRGVAQLGQVREFHDDGIIFAENMAPPGAVAAAIPAHGRAAFAVMARYNQMVLTGVLVEDSSSGRVRRGPFGMALPTYAITARDFDRFLRGLRRLAELHFAMGAERLILPFARLHSVTSPDQLDQLDATRLRIADIELFTPHLMGTARMGPDRRRAVVDLQGEVHDLPGCYVADASLFPSPIGVNPQITIMALALRLGERLAERLLAERAARPPAGARVAAGGPA